MVVASAATFYTFFYSLGDGESQELTSIEPDTLIHFSFSEGQKVSLGKKFDNLHKYQKFNGAVIVGQKDSVFYADTFGFSNYQLKDSISLHSSFQLASVSKQFTAVAILQLYQKGLLKLNDTIQQFFPEFPYKNITIHQLLVHRSGLPNYHYFMQHIPTTYDTLIGNQDIVNEMIDKFPDTYYRPNRRYHYSNTGYALLAAIVEKVSGLKFEDYLDENIFEPLQMNNSFAYRGKFSKVKKLKTQGYLYRWRKAEDNYLDGVLGDKGVYCSVLDLFKWDQGLYAGKIINADTLNLAFKPMGKPKYFNSNYGYGWRMYHWGADSVKVIFHGGWWHGYRNLLMRIPQDSVTVVVLKNRSRGAKVSTRSIMQILYPQPIVSSDSIHSDSIQTDSVEFDEN